MSYSSSRGLLRDCTTGCGTDGSICGTNFDFELAGRGRPAGPAAHTFFPFFALITLVNLKVIFHQIPAEFPVNQYKFEV